MLLTYLHTPANFNGFRVLAALLHGILVVGISQTLRRWTEGTTYIRQGDHHVGHWPTVLVIIIIIITHTCTYTHGEWVKRCWQPAAAAGAADADVMIRSDWPIQMMVASSVLFAISDISCIINVFYSLSLLFRIFFCVCVNCCGRDWTRQEPRWQLTRAFIFSFTVNDVSNCVFVCSNVVYILLWCCNCGLPVINNGYVMLCHC